MTDLIDKFLIDYEGGLIKTTVEGDYLGYFTTLEILDLKTRYPIASLNITKDPWEVKLNARAKSYD